MTEMSAVILIAAAVMFVMFMGRKGKSGMGRASLMEKVENSDKKTQRNGNANEVQQIIAQMIRFAGRRKMRIVCPGYVLYGEKVCRAVLLLVGPFGVLSLRCYGYGGRISPASNGHEWQQDMNGRRITIANPLNTMEEDVQIVRNALNAGGFSDIPVIGAAVYTRPQVQLDIPAGCRVFDRKGLKAWLESDALSVKGPDMDLEAVTKYLTELAQKGRDVVAAQIESDREKAAAEAEKKAAPSYSSN